MLFFFFISKHKKYIYIRRKGALRLTQSIQGHTRGAKKQKQKEEEIQNITSPHLEPNQSKRLIKGRGPSSIINLVQNQKLHTILERPLAD